MKAKVIGFAHKQGEYNGFKYDNYILHVVTRSVSVTGNAVEQVKVKAPAFGNFLLENGIVDTDLIGRTVDLHYGRHDALEEIELLGE